MIFVSNVIRYTDLNHVGSLLNRFVIFVSISIFFVQDKVIKQAGQETVDLGDGQHQIDIVDPATVYPTKEV